MKQFSVHAAKTQLSKLIDAALAGEEVVIAKGSKPVVRLVPIRQSGFRFGLLEGKVGTASRLLRAACPKRSSKLWEGG